RVLHAFGHFALLLAPAKDLLVESLGLVDTACVELSPAVRVGLARDECARHLAGLPYADGGPAWVLDHGHRALRANGHRLRENVAARGLRLLGLVGGLRRPEATQSCMHDLGQRTRAP